MLNLNQNSDRKLNRWHWQTIMSIGPFRACSLALDQLNRSLNPPQSKAKHGNSSEQHPIGYGFFGPHCEHFKHPLPGPRIERLIKYNLLLQLSMGSLYLSPRACYCNCAHNFNLAHLCFSYLALLCSLVSRLFPLFCLVFSSYFEFSPLI